MFWKFNLITTSHVDTVLNKENVTFTELLDEDDIIQECKAQNKKLIEFLVQPEIMDEMVSFITQEPPIELDEVVRYKYPNLACEILTSDVCAINDALAGDQALLGKLLNFLDQKDQRGPLNPLLASFFSKTLSLLITRKTEPMFEFLQGRDDFIPLLLEHFDTSAVTDLVLRLITCTENNDTRAALIKWLSDQQLVEHLVGLIHPNQSEERCTNAAQVLCDIVRVCREHMSLFQENADPDPLLETIESSETLSKLLDNMFDGEKKESVLVSGILVILALLEFKKQGPAGQYQMSAQDNFGGAPNSSQVPDANLGPDSPLQSFASLFFRTEGPEIMTALDAEKLNNAVSEVISALLPRLGDLIQLLQTPPQKPSYSCLSLPPIEKPVGFTRLEVAHLLSALLNTNKHELNQRLTELNAIPSLLDLFFSHSWNNFLHTQVEQLVGAILRNPPTHDKEDNKVHPLLDQLFFQCKIVQRILDTWEENEQEQSQPGKHRRGYMGHLTNIANHLARNSDSRPNSDLIKSKLKELPEDYYKKWETFVAETLAEINNRNQTPLVTGVSFSVLDGDNVDFRGLHVPFQQEKHFLQAFSDYQMETMTNSFDDQFGFNDEEFVESDETIPDRLSRVNGNFQLVAEENMGSAELFEQACRERIASLGDDSDEEVWDDKEITYAPGVNTPSPLRRLPAQGSASSLEEDNRDCEGDGSDTSHVLSHPIGIGVSEHTAPDSPIAIMCPSRSIVSLGDNSNYIAAVANQTRHIHDDQTMDVDSSDVWTASFGQNEGTAMDTSNPWNGEVVIPVSGGASASPRAPGSADNKSWADFSCFSFSNSESSATVSQVAAETNMNHSTTDESLETSATSQSREESKPGLPSLSGGPLANGQVPILASGPVVVVVGNQSSTPLPAEDFQEQQPPGILAPRTSLPTPPPSPVASNKMSDDPARTSASTLHHSGSTEEGSLVTESVNNPTAPEPPCTPPPPPLPATAACLQNGPI